MTQYKYTHGHLTLTTNKQGKDYVCGDIHGCYDALMTKLNEVNFNQSCDRLFALGDVIDRGPDSLKCLRLLKEDWFHCVLGNHEQMMMDVILTQKPSGFWYKWGGLWHDKLVALDDIKEVVDLCGAFVSKLPHSITLDDGHGRKVGLVHAEPVDDWACAQADHIDYQSMIWSRDRILYDIRRPIPNIDYVLVGHHPDSHIRMRGNVFYLDTGSGYAKGHITLVELSKYLAEELEHCHLIGEREALKAEPAPNLWDEEG